MDKKIDSKLVKRILISLGVLVLSFFGMDLAQVNQPEQVDQAPQVTNEYVIEDHIQEGQAYFTPEDVATYLVEYDELPPNYLTKDEAEALGWDSNKGNLREIDEEAVIGGDYFGNYEGRLPEASNRRYYEADVNYEGGYRGPERLVYSDDGLIFYTADHYDSFVQVE